MRPTNIIVFSDLHARSSRPRRRVDNIEEALTHKLDWIVNRANELEAVGVFCTGDIGHVHDWKSSLINRVTKSLKKLNCPFYSVIGNHDIPSTMDEFEGTGFYSLMDSGYLKHLTRFEDEQFLVDGFDWAAPNTDRLLSGKLINIDIHNDPRCTVAIIHASVGDGPCDWWTDYRDLFIMDYKIAAFGDIHRGWDKPYKSKSGCVLINPGCVLRQKIDEKDFIPKIAVVNSNGEVHYETIPHKPSSEIFDIKPIASDIGEKFLSQLEIIAKREEVDPITYVREVGSTLNIDPRSIEKVVEVLNGIFKT